MGRAREEHSFFHSEELRHVDVGDIRIGYKVFGAGEPLVMITGYIATMDIWSPRVLEALSGEYQVVVFDNRGMGKTSAGHTKWTIDLFAADTAGLIKALGFRRANVLGWSLGGDVALSLAVNHPEKLDRLVVYAGDCGGIQKVYPRKLRDILGQCRDVHARYKVALCELFPPEWMEEHPDYHESFVFPHEMENPVDIIRQDEAYDDWPGCYAELPDINAPTLIITGNEDVSTPPENAIMLAERIPDSWLVRFRGAGHGLMYQYPDEFARVVLAFLDSVK